MFGKLMKYELKATSKWYLIGAGGYLILSIFMGVIGSNVVTGASFISNNTKIIIQLVMTGIFFAGILALNLMNFFIIIRRFYNNIFGREGYLTWTLPVGSHSILLAKIFTAFIWTVFCFLTIILSSSIVSAIIGTSQDTNVFEILGTMMDYLGASFIIQFIVYYLLTTLSGILLLYCAIALGHLFSNSRIVMAIVFGFVLWVVLSLIGQQLPVVNLESLSILKLLTSSSLYDLDIVNFIPAYIYEIVKIILMYFTIRYITKYKLNLQ